MTEVTHLDTKYLQQIFKYIQDGIIIMNTDREILKVNPSAERLTGWVKGDRVPFCSFCRQRNLRTDKQACYLLENDEIPYFNSKMPTYKGKNIDVEMSTALIYPETSNNQKEYLLVLRDKTIQKKEEEARLSKLIIRQLIEAKESEHKRLAQELHDGVGQSLFTISVALQAIESYIKDDGVLDSYIEEVRKELEKVMDDVKSYSYYLRPQSLDQLGLVATINSLVSSLEKNNPKISIQFETNMEVRCDPHVEINLYRVIQEALHNVLKYAQASKVTILLTESEDQLSLRIADNGVGFNKANLKNEGLGLKHMAERIDQIGGKFFIDSKPNQGTKIRITIPKRKKDRL
ncbi:PAS domain-containing sensor histidine kinase [Mesobacillus zeae]|uniref:Sensor histidine kinase n=1 Tax=Mesobacillus zeae TaxID=1917180 RepID=A0A398B7V1_9BACI|nr:PAS domain-containing sensor histidine kinase [Mesobacillus zeae]RID85564.1 PAS domain-containing sensor histidine kinase [Mesobacillus zeae]